MDDEVEMPPKDIIRSIVRAMIFAERIRDKQKSYFDFSYKLNVPVLPSISTALAASLAALQCAAKAIFVMTKTGTSARWCAKMSPSSPIVAITTQKSTARRLHLYKRVIPLFYDEPRLENWHQEWWNRIHFGTTFALKTGLYHYGAKLVVLSPTEEGIGYCNGFQIVTVPYKCDDSDVLE
ncbi:pyruvate kinase-like [Colias croceus]|uniref:pyruvate kinase-like n=1 Tax=Colias crocea TaxID=72248 RepID=UPI001E281087|nr:pyruvate kinase-like [Colias croceus]